MAAESFGAFEIHGGAGGARAKSADLEAYTGIVSLAAERVESAASRVVGLARWTLDEFNASLGSAGSAQPPAPAMLLAVAGLSQQALAEEARLRLARERLRDIAYGPDGLAEASRRLSSLATHLHRTTRAYVVADHAAASGFDALVWAAGSAAGGLAGRTLLPLAAAGLLVKPLTSTPHPRAVQGLLAMAPGFVSGLASAAVPGLAPGLVGGAPSPLPGRPHDVAQLAELLVRLSAGSPWLRESHSVTVTARQVPVRARRLGRPPQDVGDVVDALALTYQGSGVVRVERITGPDGRRSWLVAIPGIQTWGPVADRNPFDLTSAVGALAGRRSAPALQVVQALEAVGAERDEPVLLAGHSLGGLVACSLAADPAFRSRFRVTHVVTAGSPVALFRVPSRVRVLSLEHQEDVVPSLDGRDNPDRATWVTARTSARADPTTREAAVDDPYVGHDIAAYVRTARRLDRSGEGLLDGWSEGFDRFAVTGGAVRVWEFRGER